MRGAFALVLLLLAPSAFAQLGVVSPVLTVEVVDPGSKLKPERPSSLRVVVTYSWGPGAVAPSNTTVHLELVSVPPFLSASLEKTTLSFPVPVENVTGGRGVQETVINLTVPLSAPAYARGNISVRARSEENGNLRGVETTSSELPLVVDYQAHLNVTVPPFLRVSGGSPVDVPVRIHLSSNGETRVTFRLLETPERSRVDPPGWVVLPPGNSSEALLLVRVRLPWTGPETGLLTLEGQPNFTLDPIAGGEPQAASILLEGRSPVPALEGAEALLLWGLLALLRGRR